MASIGLFLYTLITITSAGPQLVFSPDVIHVGLTKQFRLECIYEVTDNSTLNRITRITIRSAKIKMGNLDDYGYKIAIDHTRGFSNYGSNQGFGEINPLRRSRLRLTIKYPNTNNSCCVYVCVFEGETSRGESRKESITFEVTYEIPNTTTILNHIQDITRDLEDIKDSQTARLERLKSTFFYVSGRFQGRRYYLSSGSNVMVSRDAEAMCEIIGGNLAEIDSAEEYHFIVSFIRGFPQNQFVLTGGSDEQIEGRWINTYSHSSVAGVEWVPGEPSGGREENCLFFRRNRNFKVDDGKCPQGVLDEVGAYICELRE